MENREGIGNEVLREDTIEIRFDDLDFIDEDSSEVMLQVKKLSTK